MTKDKSRIQSCIDHINTAVDVDPWAKELVAEIGKEILKAQFSGEGTTSDCISRQAAIDICNNAIDLWQGQLGEGALVAIKNAINNLPSVQPYTDEEIQKIQELEQAQLDKAFELGREDAKPEIMPDGTLHITVNADVANIDRILLTQAGTHTGDLYYKDDEKPEPQWIPCSERLPEDKTAYYLATVANRGLFFTTTVNNNVDCVRWDYDRRKGQDSWHWCTERTVIA